MLCSQETGPTAPVAGRPGQAHSSPQVRLFGTQIKLQPHPCAQALGEEGDHQADPGPLSQQQGLRKSSRWHLGPLGDAGCTPVPQRPAHLQVCVPGCEQGSVHRSVDMCAREVVTRLDATFAHVPAGMLTLHLGTGPSICYTWILAYHTYSGTCLCVCECMCEPGHGAALLGMCELCPYSVPQFLYL